MDFDIAAFLEAERLPDDYRRQVDTHWIPLAQDIIGRRRAAGRPIVVGICGSQGSGKSTLAKLLKLLIEATTDIRVAPLSLDDIYLSRTDRQRLAAQVHPLLSTRGVPGTHDVALGIATIEALKDEGPVPLPAFDKASDDRVPPDRWDSFQAPADIILFEGWCVGAQPQEAVDLVTPVNALERDEDADGRWRRHVNDQLAGPYRDLFGLIDHLVYLRAPDFAAVRRWRGRQESKLRSAVSDGGAIMDDAGLDRFLLFYERITLNLFATMPNRADTIYVLSGDQAVARRIDVTPFLPSSTDIAP